MWEPPPAWRSGSRAWCWTSAAAPRVGLLLSGQDTPRRLHPLGSLNLYNRCVETLLPSPKEQAKIRKQVKRRWTAAPLPDFPCPVICGVGGTIRGAGKLCNYLYKLPAGNRTITLNMVGGLLERFSAPAKADLQILLKIVPERVHTLLPGLVILSTLAHRCRGDAIEVSSYGVREGFLLTEVLKRRSVTV